MNCMKIDMGLAGAANLYTHGRSAPDGSVCKVLKKLSVVNSSM